MVDRVSQINALILTIASTEEMSQVIEAIKFRQRELQARKARQFRVSDSVKFTDRQGRELVGTVTKVNTKSVKVQVKTGALWTVSPSLLKAA